MSTSKHTKITVFQTTGKDNPKLWFCWKCTNPFSKGQEILTKRSGKKNRKRYCIPCAKLVNLID